VADAKRSELRKFPEMEKNMTGLLRFEIAGIEPEDEFL
jgi:hypothetical protein